MKQKKAMKKALKIVFLIFGFSIIVNASLFAQTQNQINASSFESYKKADKLMNEVYQKILDGYIEDNEFINALRASQRLWIQFRDANIKMYFPASNPKDAYGSMYSSCFAEILAELTNLRTKELNQWLVGVKEGDGCSGSRKFYKPSYYRK